jgi:hypothetical protein
MHVPAAMRGDAVLAESAPVAGESLWPLGARRPRGAAAPLDDGGGDVVGVVTGVLPFNLL